ncbi:hypothetical protein ACFYNO_28140 [Kitasatospora sp. NPDC006697]|uniref:acyl-CoA dehydrogenase family protein n=1 Tax=Kitasatospora sp. NPDC006697 TaxID=3364020 RepID=UPI00368DCECE
MYADSALLGALSEAVALADPPLYQTFLSHYVLCVGSVAELGSPAADPAGGLDHARTKGSFMVTELGDASSHLGPRTVATYEPATGGFLLTTPDPGAAKFSSVGTAGAAGTPPQQAVVCARLQVGERDGGVFSFLVDITAESGKPAPGVALSDPLDLADLPLPYAAVEFAEVRLDRARWLADGARIDADGLLQDPAGSPAARLQRTLGVGRALWGTLPRAMAATALRGAALACRFSARRPSHGALAAGAPVLAYRTHCYALASALAEAYALRCAADRAWTRWAATREQPAPGGTSGGTSGGSAGSPGRPAGPMAFSPWAAVDGTLAVHKALATRGAARVLTECQHRCGVSGFWAANRLSGYLGLARAFENAGGDNTLILLDAGRALAEQPPGPPPPAPPQDPLDPAWWPATAALLRHRLHAELHRAAAATGGSPPPDPFAHWNPLLPQALRLGEVLAQCHAADALTETAADATLVPPPDAARLLAALHGIVQARRFGTDLLGAGLLDRAGVHRLATAADRLCALLGPDLAELAATLDPGVTQCQVPMLARPSGAGTTHPEAGAPGADAGTPRAAAGAPR